MEREKFDCDATRKSSPDDTHGTARRRFLKGTTLALPAVMTLHSVAAQAVARSSTQCANNVPQSPVVHLRDREDDYFRQKVACFDKLVYNKKKKTWSRTGQATYFQGLNSTNQRSCWRYVANGDIVPDTEIPLINSAANPRREKASGVPTNAIAQKYAIVHFSAIDGSVMAVGEPQTPVGCIMTSITMACLHSLMGRA